MNKPFYLVKTEFIDQIENKLVKAQIENELTKQLYYLAYQKTDLCDSIKNQIYFHKFNFYIKNKDYKMSGPDANSIITFTHKNNGKVTTFKICKNKKCLMAHKQDDIRKPSCIIKIITGSCNISSCLCNHDIQNDIYKDFILNIMEYTVNSNILLTFNFYINSIKITWLNGLNIIINIGSELFKETSTNTVVTYKLRMIKLYSIFTKNIEELHNSIVQSDNNLNTILGNILYRLILKEYDYVLQKSKYECKNIIAKITGMYLYQDIDCIINMINDFHKNPENIKKIIDEALDILNNSIENLGKILYSLLIKEYDYVLQKSKSKYEYRDIIGKITGMYLEYDKCDIINIIDDSLNNPENIKKIIDDALDALNEGKPNEDELLKK